MTDQPLEPPLPEPSPPDAPLVVAAFLARYFADQEAGQVQSRGDYEALFPGFAAVVGAEFDRLQQGEASVEDVVGERLAGYRIVREIGRGGQGIVYLAEDEKLSRQVALKVLPGAFTATVARQRLLREAQAASRLDDSGICTVFDAGEQDGVAFIAMQFVDGESLHDRIEREREQQRRAPHNLADALRVKNLLDVFEHVLRSLHRAHEKGLVHRDVKPSNLMVATDGSPRILDFGLAAFDDHPDGSLTGEVALGTPAYMSPEQLTAREGRVDARSDVFSLAVTLYEAFALVHPFDAPTRERLYQHILQGEPAPLRKLVPGLPRDLDVVLQCALSKDRTRRYATAEAFADDLRAVRLCEPIRARKVSALERTARWAQRNPLVAALAATLAVTLLVAVYVVVDKNVDLSSALDEAEQSSERAVAALDKERVALEQERAARERAEALYLVGIASGLLEDDPELALLLAKRARSQLDHHLTRSTLRAALERWQPRPLLPGVEGAQWVKFSHDGARLAVAVGEELLLFDAAKRELLATIACPDARTAGFWWSPDGERVVVAERNERVVYNGDGVAYEERPVDVYRAADGAVLAQLVGHRGRVACVDFHGRWLLTGDGPHVDEEHDGVARVFDLDTGDVALRLPGAAFGVVAARFHGKNRADGYPEFELLARDGCYRRVQAGTGVVLDERELLRTSRERRRMPEVFLLGYGKVCVDRGRSLEVHSVLDDEPTERMKADGMIRCLLPSGLLVNRRNERSLSLPQPAGEPRKLPMPPRDIVHLDSGEKVVFRGRFFGGELFRNTETTVRTDTVQAVFADGSMRVWSTRDLSFEDFPPTGGGAVSADFSSDGSVVAQVDPRGRVRVFRLRGGAVLPGFPSARVETWEQLHPAGDRALTFRRAGVRGDEALLVDLRDGSELWVAEPESDRRHVEGAWSPDGELCALGAEDGEVQLVRSSDGELLWRAEPTGDEVRQLCFDPTGRYLCVVREIAELWDVAQGRRVHTFDVPVVRSVMFSADGSRIVLAHVAQSQVRSVPDGALIGRDATEPWIEGVPTSVAGPLVVLARWHDQRGSRVGGFLENWLLDTRDGSFEQLADHDAGRSSLSPDGELIAMPRGDGRVELLDVASRRVVNTLLGHEHKVNRALWSADGRVLVTAWAATSFASSHDERRVCVWSRDGELLQEIEFARSGVSWVDVTRDGEWFVVKTNDGELRRYPVRPMQLVEGLALRDFTDTERARFELR